MQNILVKKMSDYLPQDVLAEIFVRASIETLLRCTSVCKLWHSIIKNPSFIKNHLNRQKTTRDLLIVRNFKINSQKEIYSWYSDDFAFKKLGSNSPYDHPYNNYFRIIDSCDGVLCLVDDHPTYSEDTFLWNPAIRVWLKLPPYLIDRNFHLEHDRSTIFGVDPISKDFKVIRIIYEKRGENGEFELKFILYSLSSNKWEIINHLAVEFVHLTTKGSTTQAYFNGAAHWVALDNKKIRLAILLFDFGKEVFRSMEMPDEVALNMSNNYGILRPAVFQGLFSVVETKQVVKKCTLWVMEEYGVEGSWVKRYEIDFNRVFDRVIGFRMNGRFLVEIKGKPYIYDPEKKDGTGRVEGLRDFRFCSWKLYQKYSLHVVGFVESLTLMERQTHVSEEDRVVDE